MDKKVILAVAGSGKTYHIVEQLDNVKKFLLITYTINNTENLRNAVIDKFGFIPNNIVIQSYFTFLYSFCYQPYLSDKISSKGIHWKSPDIFTLKLSRDNDIFYRINNKWLYKNRIAKLVVQKRTIEKINLRLEKYYDYLFIDEIQDFCGHDFNLLGELSKSKLNITLVGDFYQHTFDTSTDGNLNKALYDNFDNYLKSIKLKGYKIEDDLLIKSRRCSMTICDFVRESIRVNIYAYDNRESQIILVSDEDEAETIFCNDNIVKLFLQEHHKYNCFSENWGSSKGLEYENICVVINDDTLKLYNKKTLAELNPKTKNKFYVACTRTKNNLYFVPLKMYKKYKQKIA